MGAGKALARPLPQEGEAAPCIPTTADPGHGCHRPSERVVLGMEGGPPPSRTLSPSWWPQGAHGAVPLTSMLPPSLWPSPRGPAHMDQGPWGLPSGVGE